MNNSGVQKMPPHSSSIESQQTKNTSDTSSEIEEYLPKPQQQYQSSFLGITVNKFFGHCAGLVDVASLVLDTCRGENKKSNSKRNGQALSPMLGRNTSKRTRQKCGGTLEFPADSPDDVSAISAKTLEEMERLTRYMKKHPKPGFRNNGTTKPQPGQQLVLPPVSNDLENNQNSGWANFAIDRSASNIDSVSLGVSTSGSSSAEDETNCHGRDWQRSKNDLQLFRA